MSIDREHPAFAQPSDPNVRVWRYMNFAKYVSLLQKSSLYFPQLKILAKTDPYEGTTTKKEFDKIENGDTTAIHSQKYRRIGLSTTYVNCWHMSEAESQAMWKLYSSSYDEAVCIQTTYQKLVDALPDIPEVASNHYFIGVVQYINHHVDEMPPNNGFYPVMHKLKSFEHEREVRIVYWKRDPGTEKPDLLDAYPPGIQVPININSAIESIIVSPIAATWFFDLVKNVTEKYGVELTVSQSSLALLPYA
jgi:hypothetical protein